MLDVRLLLLLSGAFLLGMAALTGFLQHRARTEPESSSRWRVVHNGGTAGGVQLLALSAVWEHASTRTSTAAIALGVTFATWAFFIGPLARALGKERAAARINLLGGLIAGPAYLTLPLVFL